jgi:signal peptidase I
MLKFIKKIPSGKQFSFLSDGDSMMPILQSGDLVYYQRTSFNRVRENDIVLIKKGPHLFTHRIIYRTPEYAVTKGDNNRRSDGRILPSNIIAKAVRLKREGKIIRLDELYFLQSFLYFHEIYRIIQALQKKGVDVLVLKGLPLHLYYEGARPKRIYSDCDILISKSDADLTAGILKQNGYQKVEKSLSREHRLLQDKKVEESYMKLVGKFPVIFDVHYEAVFMMTQLGRLDPLYPQSLIDALSVKLLREKQYVSIDQKRFPILSDSNLILYLLLHFFHHNFAGTHRLALIHHVLETARRKKELFRTLARSINDFKLRGYVYPGFLRLKKDYNSPVPDAFLKLIRPPPYQVRYGERQIRKISLFDGEGRVSAGINRFKHLYYLSPGPRLSKLLVFLYPSVLFSLFWTVLKKISKQTVTDGPQRIR